MPTYSGANFPNDQAYTRITDCKELTGQEHPKTSFTSEYPQDVGDPFYPALRLSIGATSIDQRMGVHFVGRLGTYRYYNRVQVVAQALTLYKKLVGAESLHVVT